MNKEEIKEFRRKVQLLPTPAQKNNNQFQAELNGLRQYRDYVETRIAEGVLPETYASWDKTVVELTKGLEAL